MPLTPTQTRALLAQIGIMPRKNLGQNFLTDGNIAKKSLTLADIRPGDVVVEIGPGLGALTGVLLEAGADVFAVEIDPHLAAHLRATFHPQWKEEFHLMEGDAVEHPRAGLSEDNSSVRGGAFKVVANLPYAISTPWLDALLNGPLPERMVLMLQREAAIRFTAPPGTADRGAISIFAEAAFERAPGHTVARRCFYPEPKVDSQLLCLHRRADTHAFHPFSKKIIRSLFTQRRKQIGSLVRHIAKQSDLENVGPKLEKWIELLPSCCIDARARPEDIPLGAWLALDAVLQTGNTSAGQTA